MVNQLLHYARIASFVILACALFAVILTVSGRILTRQARKAQRSMAKVAMNLDDPRSHDVDDPFGDFTDLPDLGYDADLSPGPRKGDGWQSAERYGSGHGAG